MSFGFKIIVEGDYAAYIRPELKVERVSYDVPTPGAIEGMLKSVHWKPAIRYIVDKIIVFNPIKFTNIRRNEVKEKIQYSSIRSQMNGGDKDPCIYTSVSRSQRASTILRDVKYGIEFHFELTGLKSDDEGNSEKKHYNILKRRLENGQCFRRPCLGTNEFPVKKIVLVDEFPLDDICPEIIQMGCVDMGYMCYRQNFEDGGVPVNNNWNKPKFSDKATAIYYRPIMVNGVIDVSKYRGELKC
jgi:CRISPR-associated protein Cas5d